MTMPAWTIDDVERRRREREERPRDPGRPALELPEPPVDPAPLPTRPPCRVVVIDLLGDR